MEHATTPKYRLLRRHSIAGHWDYEQRLRDTVLAEDACLQKDSTARKEAREKLASSGKQNEVRTVLDHAETLC